MIVLLTFKIKRQIPNRSLVFLTSGESTTIKIYMMGGSQNKDSFAIKS